MLGRAAEELPPSASRKPGESVVRLSGWSSPGPAKLAPLDLEVSRGEIVGIFGLRGAGQELVAEGLAGVSKTLSGHVVVDGHELPIFPSPRHARAAGISYVPAERKRDGLVLPLSIEANLSLTVLKSVSRFGVLRTRAERASAKELRVRARGTRQAVGELSGGNQQKVLVGSRLAARSRMLVLHEPTRGVDVGARVEIHRLLRELVDEGAAMLLVTTDVEEAVLVSDRLLVMRDGELVAELTGEAKTQSQVLSVATEASPA
jgi:ABC-type sugar transport system ATPase subunit